MLVGPSMCESRELPPLVVGRFCRPDLGLRTQILLENFRERFAPSDLLSGLTQAFRLAFLSDGLDHPRQSNGTTWLLLLIAPPLISVRRTRYTALDHWLIA